MTFALFLRWKNWTIGRSRFLCVPYQWPWQKLSPFLMSCTGQQTHRAPITYPVTPFISTLTWYLQTPSPLLSFGPEERGMNWDSQAQAWSIGSDTGNQTKRIIEHFYVARTMPGALQVMYLNAPVFQMKKWGLRVVKWPQMWESVCLILLSSIASPIVCPQASLLTILGWVFFID